jgi:hypothetical protein
MSIYQFQSVYDSALIILYEKDGECFLLSKFPGDGSESGSIPLFRDKINKIVGDIVSAINDIEHSPDRITYMDDDGTQIWVGVYCRHINIRVRAEDYRILHEYPVEMARRMIFVLNHLKDVSGK